MQANTYFETMFLTLATHIDLIQPTVALFTEIYYSIWFLRSIISILK